MNITDDMVERAARIIFGVNEMSLNGGGPTTARPAWMWHVAEVRKGLEAAINGGRIPVRGYSYRDKCGNSHNVITHWRNAGRADDVKA